MLRITLFCLVGLFPAKRHKHHHHHHSLRAEMVYGVGATSRKQREACPFWNAIGALDDALGQMCGDDPEPMFNFLGPESLSLACCPAPYTPCKKEERIKDCDDVIKKYLAVPRDKVQTMASADGSDRVQQARGALIAHDDRCRNLAPMLPLAKCIAEQSPDLSVARPDLFCEMILFHAEQLGDDQNPPELTEEKFKASKCPWGAGNQGYPVHPSRHGGSLAPDDLPEWAMTADSGDPRLQNHAEVADSNTGTCDAVCPAGECDGAEDAGKPACQECKKCRILRRLFKGEALLNNLYELGCDAVCPAGVCDGPRNAGKPACQECKECQDLHHSLVQIPDSAESAIGGV